MEIANGVRVRVMSPRDGDVDNWLAQLRGMTKDGLDWEYSRICGLISSSTTAANMEQCKTAVISELRSRGVSSRRFEY